MKWRNRSRIWALLLGTIAFGQGYAQTSIDLRTQSKNVDFSALPTKTTQTGASLPGTCSVGQTFFRTTAQAGQNLWGCSAVNAWSLLISGAPASGIPYTGAAQNVDLGAHSLNAASLTIATPGQPSRLDLTQGTCPPAAATGYNYTLCMESGTLYQVSSAGVKTAFGASSVTAGTWISTNGNTVNFNPFDFSSIVFRENFCGQGSPSTGTVENFGSYGWSALTANTLSPTTAFEGSSSHPCTWVVSTAATSGEGYFLHMGTGTNTGYGPTLAYGASAGWSAWDARWVGRIGSNANVSQYMGFADSASNFGAMNTLAVRWDTTVPDTKWTFVACDSTSVCTTALSTVTALANTTYTWRIFSTASGTIQFSVNGEAPVSINTHVPLAALSFYGKSITREALAKTLRLYAFGMQVQGVTP